MKRTAVAALWSHAAVIEERSPPPLVGSGREGAHSERFAFIKQKLPCPPPPPTPVGMARVCFGPANIKVVGRLAPPPPPQLRIASYASDLDDYTKRKAIIVYNLSDWHMRRNRGPGGHAPLRGVPRIFWRGGGRDPPKKPNKRATGLKPATCAHQGSMFRPYTSSVCFVESSICTALV